MAITIPSHIKWYINSVEYGDYSDVPIGQQGDFKFSYVNLYENYDPSVTFRDAVRNKLSTLADKKLAICVSGVDSELVLREAVSMGLNVEIFFLRFWDINEYIERPVTELSIELGVPLNIIEISSQAALSYAIETYKHCRVNKPTYLLVQYLLDNIDESFYPIVCEGDMNKDYVLYDFYIKEHGNTIPAGNFIMMGNTEITYWLWAIRNNREGDYYFLSSTPELVTSAWHDDALIRNMPGLDNRSTLIKYWNTSNFRFNTKTTNWETHYSQNESMRESIKNAYAIPDLYEISYDILPEQPDGRL